MSSHCPYCRKPLDLMEIFQEGDLAAIIRMQPAFGKHAHSVMGYCYLFGVSPLKLKAKKLRMLLYELKRLFDAEAFIFDRREYRISHAGIAEALDIMIKRDFGRQLRNHNYLKQIMIGISEREGKAAGRSAERDLRRREDKMAAGIRGAGNDAGGKAGAYPVVEEQVEPPPMKTTSPAAMTDERLAANRRSVKKLLENIGGKS